jgi:hypothetical protein
VPGDAQILQDLTLIDLAGYNLLRLFGARAPATDVVAETTGKCRARHGNRAARAPAQTPGRDFPGPGGKASAAYAWWQKRLRY